MSSYVLKTSVLGPESAQGWSTCGILSMCCPVTVSVCVCVRLRVFEHVDLGEDLERWAQFDVHGRHEVVLLQQQQGLSIDLLTPELLSDLQTTCSHRAVSSQRTASCENGFTTVL